MDIQKYKLEALKDEKWRASVREFPFIQFPEGWLVQCIPPFSGAYARFRVQLPCGKKKSIYADFEERLGYFGEPYWEVYPYLGDVGRCAIKDVDDLLAMIADTSDGLDLD